LKIKQILCRQTNRTAPSRMREIAYAGKLPEGAEAACA